MDWQRLEMEALRLKSELLEYADVFDPDLLAGNPDLEIQKAGGGYLVRPRRAGDVEEVHVLLHGSVRLPLEARWAVSPCDPEDAASTLVDNCDLGTAALGMELARWIAADSSSNRCLAFFDVARVLIDGNRYRVEDQVPQRPYRGAPILRASLTDAQRRALVERWLSPWVELVAAAIHGKGVLRAFHHHTYDPAGQVGQPLDSSGGMPRPAGMVFSRSPHKTGGPTGTLLHPELLRRIVALLESRLKQIRPDAEVRVDWPYRCPAMPLLPGITEQPMDTIIYEIRKDLLRREEDLRKIAKIVQEMSAKAKAFRRASL